MAGILGLKLAGPRIYDGELMSDHFMGDGRVAATAADIRDGLRIYRRACVIQALAVVLVWWIMAASWT